MENLLPEFQTVESTPIISEGFVPNEFPRLQHTVPYRIAIIGEAPGADEVVAKRPFVGSSGRLLDQILNHANILRSACYMGNVTGHRPPKNIIQEFHWDGPQISSGLRTLYEDLDKFNPNLCFLLGATALRAAKGHEESITNWRGSLFQGAHSTPFAGRKCLGSFHPASCLRNYEQTYLLLTDAKRARTQGETPDLVLPVRRIEVAHTVEDVRAYCQRIRSLRLQVATDIEGYVDNLTCISFAEAPDHAFVVPFSGAVGNYWNEADEYAVWQEIKGLLEDRNVAKVLQNGLYDRFVLAYTYGILIHNVTDDTQYKHWEIYCELPKRLSLQASLYTLEPYYKDERGGEGGFEEYWRYNGKDSCVTKECSDVQGAQLKGHELGHYRFNMQMQDPLLYMELRGINYDKQESSAAANKVRQEVWRLQHSLNKMVGLDLRIETPFDALKVLSEHMGFKRAQGSISNFSDLQQNCKKEFKDNGNLFRAFEMCKQGYPFDDARNGAFSMFCKRFLNTQSSDQMQAFLYGQLGLPIQFAKKTRANPDPNPTTDALALLKLFKKSENPVLKLILRITNLRTQLETLDITCDPDGRIRCSYNGVGTETGRLSCSKSPTRSGYNLQTVTKKHRYLFRADDGFDFFQCDLSGADGWTVAAHCARLGDRTMLDDYLAGIKPALVIALLSLGERIPNNIPREELKAKCDELSKVFKREPLKEGWRYMGTKRVQHGSNYLMKGPTMSDQVLTDSWKYGEGDIVFIPPKTCDYWQGMYFGRYWGVKEWHKWVANEVYTKKKLESASGNVRRFFGRPYDEQTLKQALAHEPQNNTTYATNRAALNLWHDRENRRGNGSLVIEPLHQVHDALCGQWPSSVREWARTKVKQYFANTFVIAGIDVHIPYEGGFGPSWGQLDNAI
jgi:uracil-DNA glycosylase family 4